MSEVSHHAGAPRKPMTVADFAREIGVEPQSAQAFFLKVDEVFQRVDEVVQRAAERLGPIVEQVSDPLIKLTQRANLATEVPRTPFEDAGASLRNFGHAVLSVAQASVPTVEDIARKAVNFVKGVEDAPEIDGHEELLVARLRYHPLVARFTAYAIHNFGVQYADERNDARHAGVRVGRLARGRD